MSKNTTETQFPVFPDDIIQGVARKFVDLYSPTYGLRLMAVQAVLRGEESVTKANVQQVIDLLQYEVAVREAVSPVIAENPVAQMEELIRRYLPEGKTLTKRELQRKTNYNRLGIEIFDRATANMIRNGELSAVLKGKSVRYTRVRPDDVDETADSNGVEGVFNAGEDTAHSQNFNECEAVADANSECHQILHEAQMVM